jgi:predicted RNase H-like HicB family nuclease
MMMFRYLIVVEKAGPNYSAYVPDLPGCVATGSTREEAEANIRGAIEMHVNGLIEDHERVPKPQASANYIEINSPADVIEK